MTAFLFLTPAVAIWIFAEPALRALGQPPAAARLASQFLQLSIPAIAASACFEAARKFLYAQDVLAPPLYAALTGLLLLPLWQALLVRAFGFAGGVLAMVATHVTMCTVLLAHCAIFRPFLPATWPGWSLRRLLRDRRAACKFVGLSAAALLSLSEWLFWEFVCFRVGRFGPLPLAVHGTAYSLLPLLYMVPLGLTIGLSIGVGQKLGAGAVREAKRLVAMTLTVGLIIISALSLCTYLGRALILRCYTADADVIAGAELIWPWLCVDLCFDNSFAMLSGLNRGLGLQRRSAIAIVLVLWPIGLPLIAFGATSVLGVWRLMPLIYATVDVCQIACFSCASWAKLAEAIQMEARLAPGGGSGTCSSTDSSSIEHVSATSTSSMAEKKAAEVEVA